MTQNPGADTVRVARHLPQSYPRQRGLACGEVNARSMIESLGLAYRAPARPGWTVRLLGYSLLKDIQRLLEAHDLSVRVGSAGKMTDAERLDLLRGEIDAGFPVMLAIGNGHLSRDHYVPLARLLLGHYLTVYGYDDSAQTFFVYDSFLDGAPTDALPAGNETRSYAEMQRDWEGPFYYRAIGRDHTYITAHRQTVGGC